MHHPLFPLVVKTIKLMKSHLIQHKLTTVRDIFYMDVLLFATQARCKQALELVSHNLHSKLPDIGIVQSQKGLMYGNGIIYIDEVMTSWDYCNDAMLIPLHTKCRAINIDLVVIIEKDAVFKWVCTYVQRNRLAYNIIFITGKGFPDNCTKNFVQSMVVTGNCPILAFVDADVYGIYICKSFDIPSIHYGGMYLFDAIEQTLDIDHRERVLITNLLIKLVNDYSIVSTIYKRELTRNLFLSKKAELNVCGSNQDLQIINYLLSKIENFKSKLIALNPN